MPRQHDPTSMSEKPPTFSFYGVDGKLYTFRRLGEGRYSLRREKMIKDWPTEPQLFDAILAAVRANQPISFPDLEREVMAALPNTPTPMMVRQQVWRMVPLRIEVGSDLSLSITPASR